MDWMTLLVGFLAGALVVAVLVKAFVQGEPEVSGELKQRALSGQVFLVQPVPDNQVGCRCGCISGLPAAYDVSGGWGANGLLCVQCVRSEFSRWLLYNMQDPKTDAVGVKQLPDSVAGKRA